MSCCISCIPALALLSFLFLMASERQQKVDAYSENEDKRDQRQDELKRSNHDQRDLTHFFRVMRFYADQAECCRKLEMATFMGMSRSKTRPRP